MNVYFDNLKKYSMMLLASSDRYTYIPDEDAGTTAMLEYYLGSKSTVAPPASIGGYLSTSLSPMLYYGKHVINADIPKGIETIY